MLWALSASLATAKDDTLEFLHLLQREGYSDIAIDYLDQLKTDPNAPKDVMDLWDLEMSRSKKEAAKQAYSETQAKQWTEESKALFEQFIKAHPDRAEAIQEAARMLEERALEGQYKVAQAGYATDKEKKAELLTAARKIFEEIRPRFVQAEQASAEALAKLPSKQSPQRDPAEILDGENRLTVAMVDFYLAQTQEEGAPRTEALNKSLKDFDGIYQAFRTFQDPRKVFVGLRAHFWHGRLLQELGNANDARVIFEEVLAGDVLNIEDSGGDPQAGRGRAARKTGLEDFFADVEQYYLQTLYKLSKKEYLEEVRDWRTKHKAVSEKCFGYQALSLEYAKHCLEIGEQSPSQAQTAQREAVKVLRDMAKVPSPYRQDALAMLQKLNAGGSVDKGFDDFVLAGDNAVENRNWGEAAEFYEKALAAAGPKTDPQRLATVKNTLVGCYHNRALQLYQQHKVEDAIAMAKKALTKDLLQTKSAPGVAVFLMNVHYYQYLGAAEGTEAEKKAKDELLTKVSNTAKSVLVYWPAKEEGDAARILLMRLAQARGDMAEADKFLNEINPSSREYATALTEIGYSHWSKYKDAKKLIKANAEKKVETEKKTIDNCDEDRKQALDYIEKAVKSLDTPRSADAAMPDALRKAQMLLAEIYKEGEDFKKSWELYKSLIDEILKNSDKPLDETALRIFDGAGQVCLQLDDIPNITLVATKLLELGPDQGPFNLTIMNFARRLEPERKKAMADSDSGDPTALSAAAVKLKGLVDLEEKIMVNLSKRERLSPASMIWIVRTSSNLGTDEAVAAAATLIERIFDKETNDQDFGQDESFKKAAAGLHALGAQLMARQGQYQKAVDQIDALIQKYPKALDPQLSEAKIYTEWAAKDSSKYGKAIGKWDTLRKKLERHSDKAPPDAKRIDPKYDVILNEADCFFRMAQKSQSKDEAKSAAEKGMALLSPYLNLDDKIRNPSDDFKELSTRYFQVGRKLADFLGVQPPLRPKSKHKPS